MGENWVEIPIFERQMRLSREAYERGLRDLSFNFPETTLKDGDHAWLTPVKSYSDKLAIESLISQGIIDSHFAQSVLSIDFTNPLFSEKRRGLLRLLPETASPDWQQRYNESLKASGLPHGLELASMLSGDDRASAEVRNRIIRNRINGFAAQCEALIGDPAHTEDYMRLLAQRRREVFDSEISKNPRGQILEPGFRVIFPEPTPKIPSKGLHLSEDCEVVED